MDPQVQPKLLKVLEEKRFRRLGEVRDRAGRRPAHRGDAPGPRTSSSRRSGSAATSTSGSARSRCACRRCASGPRTSRCSPRLLLDGFAADLSRRGTRAARPPPSGRSAATPGRATCASCATCSSAPLLLCGHDVLEPADLRFDGPGAADAGARPAPGDGDAGAAHARGARAPAHRARPARAERPGRRGRAAARHPAQHAVPEDQEVRAAAAPSPEPGRPVSGAHVRGSISRTGASHEPVRDAPI